MKTRRLTDLAGKRIIITGCGCTKLKKIFTRQIDGSRTYEPIVINGEEFKMNMGSAAALVFAEHGAIIHMVSRTEEKLKALKEHIMAVANRYSSEIEYSVVDLMDEMAVKNWIASLSTHLPIYWFHVVGQGSGSTKTPSNRWLPFQELTLEHFSGEVIPFWATTTYIAKYLWPILERQKESRIVLISSMSAVRGYTLGASHCAAEAAMDRLANVLMFEGYKSNIFVTTLRPGAIDTGTYESEEVRRSIAKVSREYNGRWETSEDITYASPRSIGELAATAFRIPAHVTSINIVAQGQFPHEGS